VTGHYNLLQQGNVHISTNQEWQMQDAQVLCSFKKIKGEAINVIVMMSMYNADNTRFETRTVLTSIKRVSGLSNAVAGFF